MPCHIRSSSKASRVRPILGFFRHWWPKRALQVIGLRCRDSWPHRRSYITNPVVQGLIAGVDGTVIKQAGSVCNARVLKVATAASLGRKKCVHRRELLHYRKGDGRFEDEKISQFWEGTGKNGNISQQVEDMPEDNNSVGLITDMRPAAGRNSIILGGVEKFAATVVVGEGECMVMVVSVLAPGFDAIMSCHSRGDSAGPYEALQMVGSDGVGLFDGNRMDFSRAIGRLVM